MIQDIITQTRAKPSGDQYVGHCPAHDDKHPSLSFCEKNGKLLLNCHAGCDYDSIRNALNLPKKPEAKQEYFQKIWTNSQHMRSDPGNTAVRYLQNRGLEIDFGELLSLRYDQDLAYFENRQMRATLPALIASITDKNNRLLGVQRIYLSSAGAKANVPEPKKVLGKFNGGAIRLGNTNKEKVHMTEGLETGLAIFGALKEPVLVAISASNLSKVILQDLVEEIHIWVDKDRSATGEKEAKKAADYFQSMGLRVFCHIPKEGIPDDKKSIDWLDIKVKRGDEAIIVELQNGSDPHGWTGKPIDISIPKVDVPELDQSVIPGVFMNRCVDVSERLGVPIEMIFLPMLASLGSYIGLRLAVQPKASDFSWIELLTIWTLTIARPSAKKSVCQRVATAPLNKVANKLITEYLEQKAEISTTKDMLQAKYKKTLGVINKKKGLTNDGALELQMELIDIQKRLDDLPLGPKRLITSDSTMEKLCELIGDNPNGLAVIRDEVAGWILSMKKSGREGEREFYLEAWNGLGTFDQDRIGRGHIHVDNPRITVIGGTQPGKVEDLINPMSPKFVDDGLLQRFQFLLFYETQSRLPEYDRAESQMAKTEVEEVFEAFERAEFYDDLWRQDDICVVPFSAEARPMVDKWYQELNDKTTVLGEGQEMLESHLCKFTGLMPKIALLMECVESYRDLPSMSSISPSSTKKAITLVAFLEQHARNLYSSIDKQPYRGALRLAGHIKSGKLPDGMTMRDLSRKHWKGTKNKEELDAALSVLEEHNWIKLFTNKPETGRPSEIIRIHPEVLPK